MVEDGDSNNVKGRGKGEEDAEGRGNMCHNDEALIWKWKNLFSTKAHPGNQGYNYVSGPTKATRIWAQFLVLACQIKSLASAMQGAGCWRSSRSSKSFMAIR